VIGLKKISFILFLIILIACAQIKEERECQQDTDCVRVREDCCGCQAGGKSISIPKINEADYISQKEKECGDVFCIQLYACTENDDPVCQEGRCTLA